MPAKHRRLLDPREQRLSHQPHSPLPDAAPRRALVTGGAGFIGSHLVELLAARGDRVTVIDNLSTGRRSNLDAVPGTVRFIEAGVARGLEGLDAGDTFDEIYHLAAAVGVELVLDDPIGSIRTNIHETDALLGYAQSHGSIPTLIASSSEVYGKPGTGVFSEDDDLLLGPTTVSRWSYAHAKAIDEHLALAYHRQHALPVVVCRFFNTVGPRQVGRYGMVLPRFVEAALSGAPLRVYGDGSQSRCFCDGRDVVTALPALLANPEAHGRVFNLGSDHPISIADLAQTVIDTLGSSSTITLVPYRDAYPEGFEDLRHRKPDLDRVRQAVGFTPRYPLTRTITDLAKEIQNSPTEGVR